jgi:hypothetical protein
MAKPTVTEQDVSAGIKSLGGFGGLTKSHTTRRDSPFGPSFAKQPETSSPAGSPRVEAPIATATVPQAPAQAITDAAAPQVPPPTKVVIAPTLELQPQAGDTAVTATTIEKSQKGVGKATKTAKNPVPKSPVQLQVPKTELYTERVTVLMDAAMRDDLNEVARLLQRRKSDSTERITANTITRVAVRLFLDELRPSDTDSPKTESELYHLSKARMRVGG